MSSSKNNIEHPTTNSFRRSLQKGRKSSIADTEANRAYEKFPSFAENPRVKLAPLAPLAPVRPPTNNAERKQLTLKRAGELQKRTSKDNLKTEDTLVETARTADRLSFKSPSSHEAQLNESFMFTSFYKTESDAWVRPSDYLKEIK